MSDRNKLSLESQILKMKSEGIKFNIMSESDAKDFPTWNTYYFKLKSYAKNYLKSDRNNKYSNLEFAYLVELSVLDTHLRSRILDLCLSIEHQLKVMLMRSVTEDPNEDGILIIRRLFEMYPYIKEDTLRSTNSAGYDLKIHYGEDMPIWVFLELCSYNSFIKLFEYYYSKKKSKKLKELQPLIYASKFLRNAAAHNNCLLNSLRNPYSSKGKRFRPAPNVKAEILSLQTVSRKSTERILKNRVVHDFLSALLLFKQICSSSAMFENVMADLEELLHVRFLRHKDYFQSDPLLVARYRYVVKVFDALKYNS